MRTLQPGWKVFFIIVLLLAATAEFAWRGPIRFVRFSHLWSDTTQVYIPSRAWVKGLNPYSPDNFVALFTQATGISPNRSDIRTHSPYPLTTLVIMSPIAALRWPVAHILWALLLASTPVLMIWGLAFMARFTDRLITYLFAGLSLALAPLHTGIAVGNVSIPAIAISVLAVWAGSLRRDIEAGFLLGLASCLKPQLGIWFVLYYILQKRWRIVLGAGSLVAVVVLVGILRLEVSGATWLSDFLRNAREFALENPTVNFSEKDPIRFTLIDLQVLLYALAGSISKARVGALVLGGVLLCAWFMLGFRSDRRPPELLTVSTLIIISLLPAYHRNYDATVLIFPLCWFVSILGTPLGKIARIGMLLILPFAIPGAALLKQLVDGNRIPSRLVNAPLWTTLVMPHETWCLLLLSLLLLRAMAAASSLLITSPLPLLHDIPLERRP